MKVPGVVDGRGPGKAHSAASPHPRPKVHGGNSIETELAASPRTNGANLAVDGALRVSLNRQAVCRMSGRRVCLVASSRGPRNHFPSAKGGPA
jgi:hypothetical protein